MDDWPCDLGNDVARARRAHAARKARSSGPKLKDGISGPFRCYGDMDLPSYYRHQARGARRLAGLYREQRQTRVALERVAQEYNGIAQDIEKSCDRDLSMPGAPAGRFLLSTLRLSTNWAKVNRQARQANAEHGRRIDLKLAWQSSCEVEDELTR
jgi:hypothetical protein